MRFVIALAVLAISLALGGCSRPNQAAYAMPSPRVSHPIKASWVNIHPRRPSTKVPRTVNASSSPLPSIKYSKAASVRVVNPPTLPPKESTLARPQPPNGSQVASVPSPATTRHYVVVDPVSNCAVVDAKPADGLKIIGDENGYTSSEAANKALKDAKAQCKNSVEIETDSKFKAAQAKAEKVGVHKLTQEDIEGLTDEQLKRLRGY